MYINAIPIEIGGVVTGYVKSPEQLYGLAASGAWDFILDDGSRIDPYPITEEQAELGSWLSKTWKKVERAVKKVVAKVKPVLEKVLPVVAAVVGLKLIGAKMLGSGAVKTAAGAVAKTASVALTAVKEGTGEIVEFVEEIPVADTWTDIQRTVRTTLQAAGILPTSAQVEEIARQVMYGEPYPYPTETAYPVGTVPVTPTAPSMPAVLQQWAPYIPYAILGVMMFSMMQRR